MQLELVPLTAPRPYFVPSPISPRITGRYVPLRSTGVEQTPIQDNSLCYCACGERHCDRRCMTRLNINSGSLKGESVAPDYRYSCCVVWGGACILYPLPEEASTGASTPLRRLLRVIIVSVIVSRSVLSRFTTYICTSQRSCAQSHPVSTSTVVMSLRS